MPLKIQIVASPKLDQLSVDLLALAVRQPFDTERERLAGLDGELVSVLLAVTQKNEFKAKKDEDLDFAVPGSEGLRRLILLGSGETEWSPSDLRALAARAARAANASKAKSLGLVLPEGVSEGALRFVAEGLELGAYRFTKYFTGDRRPKAELAEVTIALSSRAGKKEQKAVALGQSIANAVVIARDLVNEPGNELFPARLADAAERVAKEHGLACEVFNRKEIERRGMTLLAAVGRGSEREPRFVHLSYTPKRPRKKVAFVGKGITFDSGGLCIKPAAGMGEMKSDMAGAANVIGLMATCAELALPVEVHGIIAAAENMPDGDAYRPGDVFGSLLGKTVEIVNTDAEGRLILADALAYAVELKPDLLVDNATLTGACVVALGKTCSGFYASSDVVAEQFAAAARRAGEQFWRMPLLDDLKDQLKSDIADLKHTGERWGGSVTAALFLREFVGETAWIHADIAGPAWADRASGFYPKGATGHGVLTFVHLLERLAEAG